MILGESDGFDFYDSDDYRNCIDQKYIKFYLI